MTAGPNGIDRPRWGGQVGLRRREAHTEQGTARSRAEGAAVVRISSEATALSQAGATGGSGEVLDVARSDEPIALEGYEIDNDKVAEALLRHYAPEVFQTLANAGEVEE